jgi:hypothetical protein
VFPGTRDPLAPPRADCPEVCSKFPLPGELGLVSYLSQQERFRDVWNGATHNPEIDPLGPSKAYRLDRGGDSALDRREMRGQGHVRAALPHFQFLAHGARGSSEVRRREQIKDQLAFSGDPPSQGTESTKPPADSDIESYRPTREPSVPGPAGHGQSCSKCQPRHDKCR